MYQNKIIKAVQLIKPDAQLSVSGEDIDSIVWENGETPIAKADIEARLAEAEQAIADEAQAQIDLKASAKAKLVAGEALTEDEANVMIGG
tara:strand:+ start:581 stop:850 length:270 start_codon:yes stop_codon:yes gene_type:complete